VVRSLASCLKCYKEENSGHLSKRNWETNYWAERFDLNELINETSEDGTIRPNTLY
jgi:hypothetical protein